MQSKKTVTVAERFEIVLAANGCVTGTSDEWPGLVSTLTRLRGRSLGKRKDASWLRGYCEALMDMDILTEEPECLLPERTWLLRMHEVWSEEWDIMGVFQSKELAERFIQIRMEELSADWSDPHHTPEEWYNWSISEISLFSENGE